MPEVVLGVGVAREEGVEPAGEVVADGLSARLAVKVEPLARVRLHVVQLERPVGNAHDVFPAVGADGAGGPIS